MQPIINEKKKSPNNSSKFYPLSQCFFDITRKTKKQQQPPFNQKEKGGAAPSNDQDRLSMNSNFTAGC